MNLIYPVNDHHISQPFGFDNSNHPERGKFYELFDNKHPGVDFDVPEGSEIRAAFPGIVVRKELHKGMGNVLGIRNGNIVMLYAHLSEFYVDLGNIVKQKQLIGLTGNTGAATTEPHLHFEMRDLTKKELKDMVFKPEFDQSIKQWQETFTYTVANKNTPKTLYFLAERYFGNKELWTEFEKVNENLHKSPEEIIPDGTVVTIPNY